MALQDDFLNNSAEVISNNLSISYAGYSDSDSNVSFSESSLTNEIGNRTTTTRTSDLNEIEISTTRSSTDVVDTSNGDRLEELGFFLTDSGSDMQLFYDIAEVNHTNDFALDITSIITVDRQ